MSVCSLVQMPVGLFVVLTIKSKGRAERKLGLCHCDCGVICLLQPVSFPVNGSPAVEAAYECIGPPTEMGLSLCGHKCLHGKHTNIHGQTFVERGMCTHTHTHSYKQYLRLKSQGIFKAVFS